MVDAPLFRRLFLFDGFALFVGRISNTHLHAHFAAQLAVSISEPLALASDGSWNSCSAALVPSNVPHQLRVPAAGVVLLYVDPTTLVGEQIAANFAADSIHVLPDEVASALAPVAERCVRVGIDHEADDLRRQLIAAVAPSAPARSSLDRRVRSAVDRLAGDDADDWDIGRLAADVSLSPERLRHLFRAQVGIPIRSYKAWARIRRAAASLATGRKLTETAHAVGFADSAHLSRTFRRMFGIVPSELLARTQIERVEIEPTEAGGAP